MFEHLQDMRSRSTGVNGGGEEEDSSECECHGPRLCLDKSGCGVAMLEQLQLKADSAGGVRVDTVTIISNHMKWSTQVKGRA
jgi:hypothetical protein